MLLVLNDASLQALQKLQLIKQRFQAKGIEVDFNTHALYEMPEYRKNAFWHNNRGFYMRMELQLYGKTIIGLNPFSFKGVTRNELHLEAIRVINSLVYQARKLLVNRELVVEERIRMMKFCIYATIYALAANEIYPLNKKEAMQTFRQEFPNLPDPELFLTKKVNHTLDINDRDIEQAYDFLVVLDREIFSQFNA